MVLLAFTISDAGQTEGTSKSFAAPRQSSRLAEKHAKRKFDDSDDDADCRSKCKLRRKSVFESDQSSRKRRASVKFKALKIGSNSNVVDLPDSVCRAGGNHQSDKYCHFCQHAKVNMLACGNIGCTHRYCLYCIKSHLQESVDQKISPSWFGGVWHCPTCRHMCCCSSSECDREHRHCKAYRYRQRRADVASKRATAHALVSLSSSRPAGDNEVQSSFVAVDQPANNFSIRGIEEHIPLNIVEDCPISQLLKALTQKNDSCSESYVNQVSVESQKGKITDLIAESGCQETVQTTCCVVNSPIRPAASSITSIPTSPDDIVLEIGITGGADLAAVKEVANMPSVRLDALACTAAEILARSCRSLSGRALDSTVLVERLNSSAVRAETGDDEELDSNRHYGGDAQLSALSTPPFSPAVASLSDRLILPPEVQLSLTA